MNKNAITSLSMLYALWESKRQDILSVIRPFVLFSVDQTTKVNGKIDIEAICTVMESEFGYKNFSPAVVDRVLSRETSAKIEQDKRFISKKQNDFFLIKSLAEQTEDFTNQRLRCKEHSDAVGKALTDFLNQKEAWGRNNYTQREVESKLLSFFMEQGSTILLSVDDLHQVTFRDNEINYYIAQFILKESNDNTVLLNYLIELVKGYFLTTALFLQAENPDVTVASFKDVTFYLDTSLLLAILGYKSSEANNSAEIMVNSLLRCGAKLACFVYNVEEVRNILSAYRNSIIYRNTQPSTVTLEHFDEQNVSSSFVDFELHRFEKRLIDTGITIVRIEDALIKEGVADKAEGILDDSRIEQILFSLSPTYNIETFPDDMRAINAISRIRKGKELPYIEKCKAVFVTNNTTLISAIGQYLRESHLHFGFPLSLSTADLCVIAWLKDINTNDSLPQMRLLENVVAAISPSRDLMDEYFKMLDHLEKSGDIGTEEVALMRVDIYARKQLMSLTHGETQNLNEDTIDSIRESIRKRSFSEGIKKGKEEASSVYAKTLEEKRTLACKRAEEEVFRKYDDIEKRVLRGCKAVSLGVAICFIIASFYLLFRQRTEWKYYYLSCIPAIFVAVITTFQGVLPLLGKENWLSKKAKKILNRKRLLALDSQKAKYLSILD